MMFVWTVNDIAGAVVIGILLVCGAIYGAASLFRGDKK